MDIILLVVKNKFIISTLKKHKRLIITFSIIILISVWIGLVYKGSYGATLFFTIPGSIAILLGYSKTFNRTPKSKIKKGLVAFLMINLIVVVLSLALIALGLEGAICILMAYPFLVIPMTFSYVLGIYLGSADINIKRNSAIFLLIINPTTYIYDSYTEPIQEEVTSELIINTSAESIWQNLSTQVIFKEQKNYLFKKGISYPKSIEFQKTENNLSYNCITNNDTIQLQIVNFKKNKLVSFKLNEQTIPMQELSPYNTIDAKHLHNYFFVNYGEIKLEPLDSNSTKVIAKTSYSYKIAPKWYWKLWSDVIINKMHHYVLESLKQI